MANQGLLEGQIPTGMPEGLPMPQGLPGTPEGIPGMPEELPVEAPVGEVPGQELPKEFAPDSVNSETARRMVASAKEKMYGPMFDEYANMLQRSQNFVEDAAMVVLDSLANDMAAINMSARQPPYDYLMDVAAMITEEVYDLSMHAGIYAPQDQEQELQDKTTTLTIVAGELGKEMGQRGAVPQDRVEAFMDSVFNGEYDDMTEDVEGGENISNIGAGAIKGNPLAGPPAMGPPTMPGMGQTMEAPVQPGVLPEEQVPEETV